MRTEPKRKTRTVKIFTLLLVVALIMLPIASAMPTESTVRPNSMKIRKVTTEENQLYVWVYLNTNIETNIRYDEHDNSYQTIYVYDSQQIKIPLESNQLTLQETELLADSTYTQYTIRQRLTKNLKNVEFTNELSQAITYDTHQVDQKEREFTIKTQATTIKNIIDLGITNYP